MESDDCIRGSSGVVCSATELADGKIRIVLDDVSNESSNGRGSWKHEVVVTWKDYELNNFADLNFSEKEFAAFGHYVMNRLTALRKFPHK